MEAIEVRYRSRIPVSAEDLFDWHAHPGAFQRLTPPWQPVREISSEGGVEDGSWRLLELGAGPLSINWLAVHGDCIPGRQFVDEQVEGPFQHWVHTHRFEPTGDQESILEDYIQLALPASPVSHRVALPLVKRLLWQTFRFRHYRTWVDLQRHHAVTDRGSKHIVISGASGMIGAQLAAFLTTGGHKVSRLVRRPSISEDEIYWNPATAEINATALEGVDAVIHLAGENLAGLWTAARKEAILESRVTGTRLLAETLAGLDQPPEVLISASGISYYGDTCDDVLDESAPSGEGFLAGVAQQWEAAADPAREAGIRVVHPRIAIVISGYGGYLSPLVKAFRLGLGARLGSGDQYLSWISLDDLIGAIHTATFDERLEGPLNASSPQPVTNAEFTETLARVLQRPAVLQAPQPVLRTLPGDFAEETMLSGQRAYPKRLQEAGFWFAFPTLEAALRNETGRQLIESY